MAPSDVQPQKHRGMLVWTTGWPPWGASHYGDMLWLRLPDFTNKHLHNYMEVCVASLRISYGDQQ